MFFRAADLEIINRKSYTKSTKKHIFKTFSKPQNSSELISAKIIQTIFGCFKTSSICYQDTGKIKSGVIPNVSDIENIRNEFLSPSWYVIIISILH